MIILIVDSRVCVYYCEVFVFFFSLSLSRKNKPRLVERNYLALYVFFLIEEDVAMLDVAAVVVVVVVVVPVPEQDVKTFALAKHPVKHPFASSPSKPVGTRP